MENQVGQSVGQAKKGKISVTGPPGTTYRDFMRGFEKKYPEITLGSRVFAVKFLPRAKGGGKLDNICGISVTGPLHLTSLPKAGDLDPIRCCLSCPGAR
jgi:hypothetical protein